MRPGLPLALAAALALGCAGQRAEPWSLPALERAHPELAAVPGHRLGDVQPYLLPAGGSLTRFLCRWSRAEAIPFAIHGAVSPEERRAILAAVAAWEGAGLGVRFAPRERLTRPRGIEFRILDGLIVGGSNTVADCQVSPLEPPADTGRLPARIRFASIHLARNDPHLTGRALHELGHALGFQGHPRRGDTVMVEGMRASRLAGERARRGALRGDAAVSALYALPSGTILSRRALPPARTRPVDRLAERAAVAGWSGPFVQVGAEAGRVFWRDRRGDSIGVTLTELGAARRDPARLRLAPDARARRELEGAGAR